MGRYPTRSRPRFEDRIVLERGSRASDRLGPRTRHSGVRQIQVHRGCPLTVVHRDLGATDPLAALQVRNAITTGVDTRLRFGNRNYEATGNVGLTFLDGEPAAIARVQSASTHYLQRLDQPTIRYDPTRRISTARR